MSFEISSKQDYSLSPLWVKEDSYYSRLIELYELEACVEWIITQKYGKVCLQFPETLLIDSVDIAAYIECNIGRKVFILGDTAYGSCCVDEVAARHVNGNCVIHFGHACLSPVTIPVYYVFHKRQLDINIFLDIIETHHDLPTPILMLYDVAYTHLIKELRKAIQKRPVLKKVVCVPELVMPQNALPTACSAWCFLRSRESGDHTNVTLQRAYCPLPSEPFQSIVYIGAANPNLYNFINVFKDSKMYSFVDGMDSLQEVCRACVLKRLSYLVEKIICADNVGIIIATLGVCGYKQAIDHAKFLCSMAGKKSYIISIGKLTPAKLANFSEMDIFVAISCPESDFGDKKQYMQPVVGLYELELALNGGRSWATGGLSRDFREIIKGGTDYVEPKPKSKCEEDDEIDEQHTLYHIIPRSVLDQLTHLSSSSHSLLKGWKGLEQRLGEDEPAALTPGRKGGPHTSYSSEPKDNKSYSSEQRDSKSYSSEHRDSKSYSSEHKSNKD